MVKKKQSPLLGNIGDRLQEVLKHHLRLTNDNLIYDEVGKKLDLTKIVPPADLSRILQVMGTTGYGGVSLFEKFFDLTMGRAGRYSEYEQMIYRIPEASQALQIYVDSILAPNVGNRDNQISFDSFGSSKVSDVGLELADSIFRQTGFYDILPQIVHTTILYGDCFLELDKTSSGIRYILHAPKNVTLLYDEKTDIELGLLIQQTSDQSNILKMLSYVYPSLSIPAPPRVVSVVSNVVSKNPPSKAELKTAEHQIEELLKDLIKDYGAAYKFLPPSKYVKFSLFYNNMYYPYGTSILDSIRSVSKQLLLIESALAIYRATRTPLRTLWTVEVGSTPEDQISGLVNGIMNRVRRQRVIDPDSEGGTSIDSIPELMYLEEDIWTPSINGSSLIKAEPINPADTSAYIDDVEYFKRKILAGLGIPPAYLASEQGASTRALLTLEDIRFSRTIKKHQIDFNNTLNALINNCFIILNKAELVNSVKVSLPEPRNVEDNIRVENISSRISTANSFMDTFPNVPKIWIMRNIVGISDQEIEEMEEAITEQEEYSIFKEQFEASEEEKFSPSGGGGGFSPSDFNESVEDEFGEFPEEEITPGEFEEEETVDDSVLEGPMGSIDLGELEAAGEET